VILPLDPDKPSQARVLVAGGGGAPDGKLNRTTVASTTAEIFDFDSSTGSLLGQAGWRVTADQTDPATSQTFLTTPRFMGDAVLLPDGTVAIIGDAGAGQAARRYWWIRPCRTCRLRTGRSSRITTSGS
jgi:hypothetical protein